ncbi:MAG: hypothetical protein AAFR55_09420, partial [Pseudomonadota bacterium]
MVPAIFAAPGFAAATDGIAAEETRAPETCSERYHNALQRLRDEALPRVKAALNDLIEPGTDRATTWTFWSPKPKRRWRRRGPDGRVKPLRSRGRICLDERWTRRGKLRCRKWARETPELRERLSRWVPRRNPRAKRAERRHLKFLNDTVANAGALSAFKEGGRFYWLIRRYVIDLEAYFTQPHSPSMCAGVPTLVSFYIQQFEPYDERIAFIDQLEKTANRRLTAQITALEKINRRDRQAAEKAARKAAKEVAEAAEAAARQAAEAREAARAAAIENGDEVPPKLTAVVATEVPPPIELPPPPRAPSTFDLTVKASAIQAFMQGLPPLVDPASAPEDAAVETLADARLALDAERVTPISKRRHDIIVRGLRALETR